MTPEEMVVNEKEYVKTRPKVSNGGLTFDITIRSETVVGGEYDERIETHFWTVVEVKEEGPI